MMSWTVSDREGPHMNTTAKREHIEEEIDLGLRDDYGVAYGGCDAEIQARFFACNDDWALIDAIVEAQGAAVESDVAQSLDRLFNDDVARAALRSQPEEQLRLGIAGVPGRHPLFSATPLTDS